MRTVLFVGIQIKVIFKGREMTGNRSKKLEQNGKKGRLLAFKFKRPKFKKIQNNLKID